MTRKSKACGYLGNAPFAVNILASDQVDTAMHFAGRPQRTEPRWIDGPTAPPARRRRSNHLVRPVEGVRRR